MARLEPENNTDLVVAEYVRASPQRPLVVGGDSPYDPASLARLEGRVALEELLKRFPEWEVDRANAKLAPTSTVRGWETLPVFTR